MENPAIIGLIILLLPIAAFAVLALFHNLLPRHGDWLGTGGMFVAMLLAFYLFIDTSTNRLHSEEPAPSLNYEWLKLDKAPGVEVNGMADNGAVVIGIQIDNLTSIMLVVVTVVSFVVHLFSIGYMHGDSKYGRFFASLSMFTASMLGLVLSDNLLTLYMSWEVMGLASWRSAPGSGTPPSGSSTRGSTSSLLTCRQPTSSSAAPKGYEPRCAIWSTSDSPTDPSPACGQQAV